MEDMFNIEITSFQKKKKTGFGRNDVTRSNKVFMLILTIIFKIEAIKNYLSLADI